jgi:signal transduction histidine kinase
MNLRHWSLSRLNPRVAAVVATALTIVITFSIWGAPVLVQFGIAYSLPIFLCAWTRNRKFLWTLAVVAIIVSIEKVIRSEKPQQYLIYFYANRVIGIITLVVCALIAQMLIGLIETLEAEHQRLSTVLSTVPVGVTIADARRSTIIYNPTAAKMLGAEPDRPYQIREVLQKLDNYRRLGGTIPDRPSFIRAMEGEEVAGMETDLIFPDGRRMDMLVSATPLRDRSGRIVGAVSGFVDITELKQMQQELDEQRRRAQDETDRKSRFLAAVSHDIRTPANAINLLAELVERSASSPSLANDLPEIVRDLKSSANSLVRLVSDVLDLTRLDQGRVELSPSEFSLSDLLTEESHQFMLQARDKGVEFVCHPPPPSLVVRMDRTKLARMLNNLLGNAVKFTSQGTVTLDGCHQDGAVHIRVSDTGPGISAEHHELIFDEYFQIKNPQREHEKGSGLGLAICKRLALVMNAELMLASKPGDGATFTIVLPKECVVHS